MSVQERRAAAVGIAGRDMEALDAALAKGGYVLAGSAPDGEAGLRLIERTQPELVVVAAIMRGMDGAAFVCRARRLRLSLRPALALLRPAGLRLPGENALASLDVRIIDAPLTEDALSPVLAEPPRGALPPAKAKRLAALLDALGVPLHPGRDCLERAIALVWGDRRRLYGMKNGLYPELARQTGLSPARAERAMRHAIDAAWKNGALEAQLRIFGDTIDARRGKPTCGEMIAQLAEELRWEG